MVNVKLYKAFWLNPQNIVVCWDKDVIASAHTKIVLDKKTVPLQTVPPLFFARYSGYEINDNRVHFYLDDEHLKQVPQNLSGTFFVAGSFNQWDFNHKDWAMHRTEKGYLLTVPRSRLEGDSWTFKFVHESLYWIPTDSFINPIQDAQGNSNLKLDRQQSGKHWQMIHLKKPLDLCLPHTLTFNNISIPIDNLAWAKSLYSESRLGNWLQQGQRHFALFAPRALKVDVLIFKENKEQGTIYHLEKDSQGVWACKTPHNYSGYCYEYHVYNPLKTTIVDPYANALKSPQGPAYIYDPTPSQVDPFKTPEMRDLVILEAHVRDLLANDPALSAEQRYSFKNLIQQDPTYWNNLNVNAIELLPITEYDARDKTDYHWGYMPAHFFAPSSYYGTPKDFQDLVTHIHQQGKAVILDLVYNHVGCFNDLQRLDKNYYLRNTNDSFSNFSGCGNDFCTEAPMAKRLIIDSLLHFVRNYHVDGFRLDLAELLGLKVLQDIEFNLRAYKQDIILIAEPWSFRGHIAKSLYGSSYASWNDGYRNFIPRYLQGFESREGLLYFLTGSNYICKTPQQSINYTESHDDLCWIDKITELPHNNGQNCNAHDRQRTHCMFTLLMCSMGIPMIHAGQDYLQSKKGCCNSYNRGDLNAFNYQNWSQRSASHDYVSQLIALRNSTWGKLFKLSSIEKDYLKIFAANNAASTLVLYNANHSQGPEQILLGINPYDETVTIPITLNRNQFIQIADTERVQLDGLHAPRYFWDREQIIMPPLSCAIWKSQA